MTLGVFILRCKGGVGRVVAAARARPWASAALGVAMMAAAGLGWWILAPAGAGWLAADARGGVRPAGRPTGTVTFGQGCLSSACHTDLRAGASRHAPILEHACGACHAADAGGHRYPLARPAAELCTPCHTMGSGHAAAAGGAMAGEGCLACHRPHASPSGGLLNRTSVAGTCGVCHGAVKGAGVGNGRHAPFVEGRCDLCHEPHGPGERGSAGGAIERCGACHTALVGRMAAARHTHLTVDRSCAACHEAHGSAEKGLLRGAAEEACVRCHAAAGVGGAGGAGGAGALHGSEVKGGRCTGCHDPHASDHGGMLREGQEALCLSCHERAVKAADGRVLASLPAAQASGGGMGHRACGGCHAVHGGAGRGLLRGAVPQGRSDQASAALCLGCHDAGLATAAAATRFRDGSRNLHEAHLSAGERSLACVACHAAHDAGEPGLIARTVNFEGSGWVMPMGFVATAEGGTCGPGCHEPQDYSRRPGGARAAKNGGAP